MDIQGLITPNRPAPAPAPERPHLLLPGYRPPPEVIDLTEDTPPRPAPEVIDVDALPDRPARPPPLRAPPLPILPHHNMHMYPNPMQAGVPGHFFPHLPWPLGEMFNRPAPPPMHRPLARPMAFNDGVEALYAQRQRADQLARYQRIQMQPRRPPRPFTPPGEMDYDSLSLDLDIGPKDDVRPFRETYKAPEHPPRPGFTRTPKSTDTLICAGDDCEHELGTAGDDGHDEDSNVYLAKCGHVSYFVPLSAF